MTMFHVISDIVWPYTHSSVTGKMAGTSVIPDFLVHWHTESDGLKLPDIDV